MSRRQPLRFEVFESRLCLDSSALIFSPVTLDCCEPFQPRDIDASDVDNDGDLDLFITSGAREAQVERKVFLFENRGDGSFEIGAGHPVHGLLQNFWQLSPVDIDGDGDDDIVGEFYDSGQPVWLENVGGSFSAAVHLPTNRALTHRFFQDLDNDGDSDLVWFSTRTSELAWYENRGINGFQDRGLIAAFIPIRWLAFGDIDGDRDIDIVTRQQIGDPIVIYRNIENGTEFAEELLDPNELTDPGDSVEGAVELADLDQDGDLDIAISRLEGGRYQFRWLENNGQGDFLNLFVAIDTAGDFSMPSLRDFNGDGDIDLVPSPDGFQETYRWFKNNGPDHPFSPVSGSQIEEIDEQVTASVWGDLDGDGDLDWAFTTGGFFDDIYGLRWAENKLDEGFGDVNLISPEFGVFVDVTDIDNDGDLDILATKQQQIVYYENLGDRYRFADEQLVGGTDMRSISLFDFDADGDKDIIGIEYADLQNPEVVWFEKVGATYSAPQTILTGYFVNGVRALDFDGDGLVDLVANIRGAENIQVVAFRQTKVKFELTQVLASTRVGRNVFLSGGLSILDNDGDGDLDILISRDDDRVTWHENTNGRGSFVEHTLAAETPRPSAVHNADLDGDGDLDLLVAVFDKIGGFSEYLLYWYENIGGANEYSPKPKSRMLANDFAYSIRTVDLDTDGDLDVVYGSIWFENLDGKGSLSSAKFMGHADFGSASGAIITDIDNDEDLDVIAISLRRQWMVLFENRVVGDSNDDGKFDSSDLVAVFQAGHYEDALHLNSTFNTGDWNGDLEFNSSDLVLAFQTGNYVSDARSTEVAAAVDDLFRFPEVVCDLTKTNIIKKHH